MLQETGETPIKTVMPDSRGRISLGKEIIEDDETFKVFKTDDGDIILRPFVTIPKRELWVVQNKQIMDDFKESYSQYLEGETEEIDPKYLEE